MQKNQTKFKNRPQETAAGQMLKAEIEKIRCRMDSVTNQFDQEIDPTLIDCYIYELKAAQLRYQFLLRRFKTLEAASRQNTYCESS